MYIDILIFALVAAFLIYRLNSVLGTRHGEERERKNPFDPAQAEKPAADNRDGAVIDGTALHENENVVPLAGADRHIDASLNQDGRIETGLRDIAQADSYFEINTFMQGARGAFEMIVLAYSRGDLDTLQPLLSPKLFGDFSAGIKSRLAQGHTNEVTIHRITSARIVEAHLGGTMAYVTVDFDVEETSVTRDASGNIVDGSPDKIFSVEDIWTFTRDVRAADPNWTLIETRAAQK
ncbi:MAG: Tim44/TimA family putative adaptor protein [Bdellovibrionales bacterium]|nr:Tim44/TimA family putative adaptor protein [Bdellovibrionales bacterium]